MGNFFARIWKSGNSTKNFKITMLGLDGAGKTTILYKMKLGEIVATIPTIGFNMETVKHDNVTFDVWDIGGGTDKSRSLWSHYFANTDGLVYVLDSNDRNRLDENCLEL